METYSCAKEDQWHDQIRGVQNIFVFVALREEASLPVPRTRHNFFIEVISGEQEYVEDLELYNQVSPQNFLGPTI